MSILNKKKYVAGISGGPDSMALLHMYRNHIKAVCIVNYHKREQANQEVLSVQEYCKKYKIACEVLDVDPQIYSENEHVNFQNLARQIRYDFFYETAKKYLTKKIILAHHLDDYLETAYYQKQRHSKSLYYGIDPHSMYRDLKICRPFLLKFRKSFLEQYCIDLKIKFFYDLSNFEDIYERNKIRKIINSWTTKEYNDFKKEIKSYNAKNKALKSKIDFYFKRWEKLDFILDFILNFDNQEQYYLIYQYLKNQNEINKSQNKINAIIDFLKVKNNKHYRLENKKFLILKNDKLLCEVLENGS